MDVCQEPNVIQQFHQIGVENFGIKSEYEISDGGILQIQAEENSYDEYNMGAFISYEFSPMRTVNTVKSNDTDKMTQQVTDNISLNKLCKSDVFFTYCIDSS